MSDSDSAASELEPFYRMPRTLGPAPGPRNMPRDKRHLRFTGDVTVFNALALSEAAALERLLPEGCRLSGDPLIDVNVIVQKNLGWLAGRGYNYLTVRIPVVYAPGNREIECAFMPVLWENMADPIITGRDELGSPKLFANIPDPCRVGSEFHASADWEGFRFFEMRLGDVRETDESPPPARPLLLSRYLPRVGNWGCGDVAQIVKSFRGQAPAPQLQQHAVGQAQFWFNRARWEDMPTQYTYVNALAALPIRQHLGARIMKMSGIGDLAAYEILD